jgi:hypothetical protein
MKAQLMGLIRWGLSFVQEMVHHKTYVIKKALWNEPIICDTFVLPSNIKNLTKKKVDELWQKDLKDLVSVKIWVMKNPKSMFYYVEHVMMELNCTSQDDMPFTLGIQLPW